MFILVLLVDYVGDRQTHGKIATDFSLFASDPTEKHAWHTTLNTVTNSSREWAYVGNEIKDSCAYITGKKK